MKEDDIKVLCDLPRSPRFGRRQLVLIRMACVEPWGKNPEVRTTDLNLKSLKERLTGDVGQLMPGSVVACGKAEGTYRFRLVDGHRRHAIMRDVVDEFLAILYLDVESGTDEYGVLFETLNSATRSVGKRERVWLALNNEEVAAGKEAANLAEEIRRGLSKAAMKIFMEEFCPTHAFELAKRAHTYLRELNMVDGDTASRKEFISSCLVWQIEQHEQESLKHYLEDVAAQTKVKRKKAKLETLQECIARNQSFPAGAVKGKATDESDEEDEEEAPVAAKTNGAGYTVRRRGNAQLEA